MNDRELLEMAAKAAGIKVIRSRLDDPLCLDMLIDGSSRNAHHESGPWNPLTDDGDALRLAVRLGLDVFSRPAQWAECGRIGTAGCRENYSGSTDPYAATRRAITRAAAEIGKAMTVKEADK